MNNDRIKQQLEELADFRLSPLDFLPQQEIREKIINLAVNGVPETANSEVRASLENLRRELINRDRDDIKVVVFGGGTGLSNVIGGDSRQGSWLKKPFKGLKEIFPNTKAVVCVTDNGGSTGNLLKDVDLFAIGDIRHVLLSSIQLGLLQRKYKRNKARCRYLVSVLAGIFNFRYSGPFSRKSAEWFELQNLMRELPPEIHNELDKLFNFLFTDANLKKALVRSHCVGNLLIAAAILRAEEQLKYFSPPDGIVEREVQEKLRHAAAGIAIDNLGQLLGAGERAVMPCTSSQAQLEINYTNGVTIPGEHKLGSAQRGVPVKSASVTYCSPPLLYEETIDDILDADILILAPGSLYSSIIPIFKLPELAEAVKSNDKALKLLISNLWVQSGETDLSTSDPQRKFHVSDMLRAYQENIPGGIEGMFSKVLCVSLRDIPASILQSYAVEDKIPIYLDREKLLEKNCLAVECDIYDKDAIVDRGVIQHDPENLSLAVLALFRARAGFTALPVTAEGAAEKKVDTRVADPQPVLIKNPSKSTDRYQAVCSKIEGLSLAVYGEAGPETTLLLRKRIIDVLWDHPVIPLTHLEYFTDIDLISPENWNREQKWDNVFSYFEPEDRHLKFRADLIGSRQKLETALMIALGESLLGNYARKKQMQNIEEEGLSLGRAYHLYLREPDARACFLSPEQLNEFLLLARMCPARDRNHYTRLLNNGEGFTPPGLMMGLMYAWYVDNRLATHIEYKMSVLKIKKSDLIPAQYRLAKKRQRMINFFREVVFSR